MGLKDLLKIPVPGHRAFLFKGSLYWPRKLNLLLDTFARESKLMNIGGVASRAWNPSFCFSNATGRCPLAFKFTPVTTIFNKLLARPVASSITNMHKPFAFLPRFTEHILSVSHDSYLDGSRKSSSLPQRAPRSIPRRSAASIKFFCA